MTTNTEQNGKGRAASKDSVSIGIDDGHAMTKIAIDGKLIKFPSRACAGDSGISSISGTMSGLDNTYETDGVQFVVGEHVEGEDTQFTEYPFSPINRVIVHHALRLAGYGGHRVKLATGLPVAQYFSASKPNRTVIEKKNDNLKTPVSATSGPACAEIVSAHVVPEGIAAWVDYSVNDQGQIILVPAEPAAVIDIGGGTTDIVTILPGWKIDHRRSGTSRIGVLELKDIIREKLKIRFDLDEISQTTIDKCLETSRITLWNKEHDIHDIVNPAKKEVGEQIFRDIQRHIGKGAEFSKILFVGGGSVVFDSIQNHFPNKAVHNEPEFANARGILKYIKFIL